MKFLLLTVALTSGGAERQLLFCARTLVELGHAVTIVTFRSARPNARMLDLKTSISAAGVEIMERNGLAAYFAASKHIRRHPGVIVWAWGLRCGLFAKLLTTLHRFRLMIALREASPSRMKKFKRLERWRAERVALYLNNSRAATALLGAAVPALRDKCRMLNNAIVIPELAALPAPDTRQNFHRFDAWKY